jgi:hypothetical protein
MGLFSPKLGMAEASRTRHKVAIRPALANSGPVLWLEIIMLLPMVGGLVAVFVAGAMASV